MLCKRGCYILGPILTRAESHYGDGGGKKLFTVNDYYKMLDAGILREDDRVELIDGEIIERVAGAQRQRIPGPRKKRE